MNNYNKKKLILQKHQHELNEHFFIAVYLKIELNDEGFLRQNVCVNINNKVELNQKIWIETFYDLYDSYNNFFEKNSICSSDDEDDDDNLSSSSTPVSTPQLLIYNGDNNPPCVLNKYQWEFIVSIRECISLRISILENMILTFENRINYFKNAFKHKQCLTSDETKMVIESVYDNTSIVDCELKCIGSEFLWYYYIISHTTLKV
ncbi:hypothetical protein [Trichoplusia ni ascovirus 2c]|uniref:hypothetical protein n=1 Tax=Trichoplusia ni ascovirus 2c TaxID=328615 RepID=UPI0000E441FF|nr:hypothetical protein TNAV2c_gp039 [Trichoplusia ni ascovirus 2c]ABF70556.1 hypothetical protein [Trichoplusia ni ascovirus 2c]